MYTSGVETRPLHTVPNGARPPGKGEVTGPTLVSATAKVPDNKARDMVADSHGGYGHGAGVGHDDGIGRPAVLCAGDESGP